MPQYYRQKLGVLLCVHFCNCLYFTEQKQTHILHCWKWSKYSWRKFNKSLHHNNFSWRAEVIDLVYRPFCPLIVCTVRLALSAYMSRYSTTCSICLFESVQHYLLYLPIWVGTVLLTLSAYMSRYSTTCSIWLYESVLYFLLYLPKLVGTAAYMSRYSTTYSICLYESVQYVKWTRVFVTSKWNSWTLV